jgi:hypothetical protein
VLTSIHHVHEIHPHDHGDDLPIEFPGDGLLGGEVDILDIGTIGLVLKALDLDVEVLLGLDLRARDFALGGGNVVLHCGGLAEGEVRVWCWV